MAVVDASSEWAQFELGIALSKLGPDRILAISDKGDVLATNSALKDVLLPSERIIVLRRPDAPFADAEPFLQQVASWFENRAEAIRLTLDEEPERLLEMGSPRAAVIAAITLLEVQLRKKLDLTTQPARPMSLAQLVRLASTREVIGQRAAEQIQTWLRVRNAAVHTPKPISTRDARVVVRGVRELIQRLTVA